MAINLTVNQFEDLNLFTNRNMEKVIGGIINNSSNGVLVNMGEDSVIILDHTEGQFYIADYSFDRDKLALTLENFDPIEIVREEETFEDRVYEYFESEEEDVKTLVESYKNDVMNQDKFITELINDAMSRKSFDDVVDYKTISEAVNSVELESTKEPFFASYKERLTTHPLTEVKMFDWENSVTVSLVETESRRLINKTAIQRANDLWKKPEFKKLFSEAAEIFVEDVEEGVEKFKELFETYPQIFFLDAADRKSVFGKTLLGNNNLREDMDDVLKGLNLVFEKYDLKEMADEYLSEADDMDQEDMGDEKEGGADDQAEAPKELEQDDKQKLLDDLKKIAEKLEDEDAKKKIDDLIEKYEKSMEEGTRPDLVKEAVAILSL